MKRLITACTLLFLLSVSCFAEYQAVARTTDALAAAVDGQTDPAVLTECFDAWADHKPLLASLIRHNEIDQIENLYRRAIQAANNRDLNETRLQVAELTGMLRHLPELEYPSLHNVF